MGMPRDPRNRNGPEKPPGTQTPRRFLPSWLWWTLLLAIVAWNAYSLLVPKAPPAASLSYTEFLEQVRAENVASVTIAGQAIEGQLRSAITRPVSDQSSTATGPDGEAEVETSQYEHFTTVAPPFGDEDLLTLLQEQNVAITVRDTTTSSWLTNLGFMALPLLLLFGLIFLMSRQAQRGQQSLFSFGGSKARLYNQEKPGTTFADVAGSDDAKLELTEVVDFLKRPERYRALGARLPRGVLLVGPPGTGKTLLAKAVAGEAQAPFFSISASEFVEMFVGVGASRVRDLFNKAKAAAPSIIFVDELDAVGRQRGAGMGGGNDEREQTLNQLLVEMDGFDEQTNVIVIAATNRPDVLDPALLRPGRFDRQVTVGLPDRTGREAILKIHTRKLRTDPNVDLGILARRTPGFAGADLANLANEAALFAARRDGTEVMMRDFDDAQDKIVFGTRQATVMSEEERRVVAYHEAGHALVALLTPGADPVNKVTIIPHGRALGATEQLPEDDRHNYTRDYLLDRLAIMLGGRASEELVFNQPTTGAENDLKQATHLARRMVGLWGMSEGIGPVSYGVGETHPFLGREFGQPREYAEATAAELDAAVRDLVETARQNARDLLEDKRWALDAIAEELVAKETLNAVQLRELLRREPEAEPSEKGLRRVS